MVLRKERATLDFSITELLREGLAQDNRPPDGKLHPSGDLLGSLRHAQLRAAGAPTIPNELASSIRLMTGTMWHSYFERLFRSRGLPVMTEVKLDRWLPEGWSGTADWILWSAEHEAFVLVDLKTMKSEGIRFIESGGMKEEHRWQASAYWHALYRMGLPLLDKFLVLYLPMTPLTDREVEPILTESQPVPFQTINPVMEERWVQTETYLSLVRSAKAKSLRNHTMWSPWENINDYLVEALAPVQDRVFKFSYSSARDIVDVKLAPHWSAAYCQFPDELCDCNTQATEKVGHFTHGMEPGETIYVPRKGYEHINPPDLSKEYERKLLGK